jgi:hypothetical protein
VETARYDGLADEYDAFVDRCLPCYLTAVDALRRLPGRGCGRGRRVEPGYAKTVALRLRKP